jgi:hypothetical protein
MSHGNNSTTLMKIVPEFPSKTNIDGSQAKPHFFKWVLMLWEIDDEKII